MLKKYFLSNIQMVLLLNILVKPIWIFFIDRNVQLKVGHEEYGLYNALVSLTLIFNILLDVGITNFNNKHIAENSKAIEKLLPNLLVAKSVLSIFYFLVLFIVAYLFNYQAQAIYLLLLLAIVQFLNSLLQFLRSNISANHDFKMDSFLSVFDKIIMIVAGSILLFSSLVSTQHLLHSIVWFQMLAYIMAIIVAFIFIIKKYTAIHFSHISVQEIIKLCKSSLPFAVLILFMAIYMRSDTLMLERLESAKENGLYANANRILDVANMLGFLFAGVLLPMFARLISQQNNVKEIITTSVNLLLPISLGVAIYCFFYSHEIMQLLYHDNSFYLSQIFRFVMLSFPAYCIMYIYSTLLTANGNIKQLIVIAIIGSVLSIVNNYVIIPHYKALGVAHTAFMVEWILAILYIIFCVRQFSLRININWILKYFLYVILFIIMNYALSYFAISYLIAMPIHVIAFIALVYGLKFWDKKNMMAIVKTKVE